MSIYKLQHLELPGGSADVHLLGRGEPLLLLHGGWASARAHWQGVWGRLAETFRVIAPELPGVVDGKPLGSYVEYSTWAAAVIDQVCASAAVCVGNSLGAIIAWCLACRAPGRVRRLVLVDGGWLGHDPMSRALLSVPSGVWLLRKLARHNTFSSSTLARAFADPRCVPEELAQGLHRLPPSRFELSFRLFCQGAPRIGVPCVPTLVAWGERDRLTGWTTKTGERLARSIPGATLHIFKNAGHLPQIEQPEEFVRIIRAFASS